MTHDGGQLLTDDVGGGCLLSTYFRSVILENPVSNYLRGVILVLLSLQYLKKMFLGASLATLFLLTLYFRVNRTILGA